MAFAGWNPGAGWQVLDLEGHLQTRLCSFLVPPALDHLKIGVDPQLANLFKRLIPIDNVIRQLLGRLFHAPLPEFRALAGLTPQLDHEYTRVVGMLLPPGVVIPIEETMLNLIIDRRLLIDEAIPLPYHAPPVMAPEAMNLDAENWLEWEDNDMSDGDDESEAAQILLRLRPSILEGVHPWRIQRRRKAITQELWAALNAMIPNHEAIRFQRNASWLIDPLPFELRDMLMTFQFNNYMTPRVAAGLPVLIDLCPFTE